jgi:hypothetical protein
MKAVWHLSMVRWAIGESLIPYALATNLKITLISAMVLNCLIESAPGTFGMRVSTRKLRREMSTLPNAKSFRRLRIGSLRTPQKFLKKATGSPSEPDVESGLIPAKTSSNPAAVKVMARSKFSSLEICLPKARSPHEARQHRPLPANS